MKGSTANRVGQTDAMGAPLMATKTPASAAADTETLIRSGFIRKVYGILSIQLMATFGEMAVFVFVNPVRKQLCAAPFMFGGTDAARTTNLNQFCASAPTCCAGSEEVGFDQSPNLTATYLMYGSMAASIVLIFSLVCCISNARVYPRNMILLSLFTIAQGTSMGVMCAFTDATSILMATGLTAVVVITLTVFARYTSIDFTGMGIYLYVCLVVFVITGFIAGIVGFFLGSFRWMQLLYALGGVLLFSCYLVYDTQLIIGGKHAKFQFSVDDYVFAALNLYLDIINLFLYILQLLNQR